MDAKTCDFCGREISIDRGAMQGLSLRLAIQKPNKPTENRDFEICLTCGVTLKITVKDRDQMEHVFREQIQGGPVDRDQMRDSAIRQMKGDVGTLEQLAKDVDGKVERFITSFNKRINNLDEAFSVLARRRK